MTATAHAASDQEGRTVEIDIPARFYRLSSSHWHWVAAITKTARWAMSKAEGVLDAMSVTGIDAFFDFVDYPLYVVTVGTPDTELSGCLAGFVTQCSIDPPNLLVCVSKENHTLRVARQSSFMGIHLLACDQVNVARLFAEETGDRVDKFASAAWRMGPFGAPILAEVAVAMEAKVLGHHSVGDHDAFLVQGLGAIAGKRESSLLTSRNSPRLNAGHPA